MSEIAERARVPKSLIHHHFGTKQKLWMAVKRSASAAYHARQSAIFAASEQSALAMLRESMFVYAQFLRDNPYVMRLAQWSRIDEDKDVDRGMLDMLRRGSELVRRGQDTGLIRGDLDPELSVLALVALTQHGFEDTIYRNTDFGGGRRADADLRTYLDTMWKILEQGIAVNAETSAEATKPHTKPQPQLQPSDTSHTHVHGSKRRR